MRQFRIVYVSFIFLLFGASPARAQSSCAQITQVSLQKLAPLLEKNDFSQVESLRTTLESVCGKSEFTMRLQIIQKLIQKIDTKNEIKEYLDKHYDEVLVNRYDNTAEEGYASIYAKNKELYNFIPLNHPVDSLIKIKSLALLNSQSYTLTPQEHQICLLFADDIDGYYVESNRSPRETVVERSQKIAYSKEGMGFGIYAGALGPIGENSTFTTAPSFGFSVMSPLANPFVFELALKFRFNTNDKYFDFNDQGTILDINSSSSFFFGGTAGYKALDNGTFIILPKIGAGLGFINTGLSEVTYYDDYDENGNSSSTRYNNVNTLHSHFGIAFLRHVKGKKFVGLEASYHYIPYNWDSDLITPIQSNYWALELFLKL